MDGFETSKKRLAFNAPNIDSLLILIDISYELDHPFIIQISEKLVSIYGIELFDFILKKHKDKIWFNLDHCKNINLISKCTHDNGWTSALFDASDKSLIENIKLSNQAKDICTKNGLLLECEVGALKEGNYSDITEIEDFITNVNCDLLGIAVGTAHGKYVGGNINYNLISSVYDFIEAPIVIHGGSGLDNESIEKAMKLGAFKLNISTGLKKIYLDVVKDNNSYNVEKIKEELHQKFLSYIKDKINLININLDVN
jgi:fructose/tagatose bisphosphate aldolase